MGHWGMRPRHLQGRRRDRPVVCLGDDRLRPRWSATVQIVRRRRAVSAVTTPRLRTDRRRPRGPRTVLPTGPAPLRRRGLEHVRRSRNATPTPRTGRRAPTGRLSARTASAAARTRPRRAPSWDPARYKLKNRPQGEIDVPLMHTILSYARYERRTRALRVRRGPPSGSVPMTFACAPAHRVDAQTRRFRRPVGPPPHDGHRLRARSRTSVGHRVALDGGVEHEKKPMIDATSTERSAAGFWAVNEGASGGPNGNGRRDDGSRTASTRSRSPNALRGGALTERQEVRGRSAAGARRRRHRLRLSRRSASTCRAQRRFPPPLLSPTRFPLSCITTWSTTHELGLRRRRDPGLQDVSAIGVASSLSSACPAPSSAGPCRAAARTERHNTTGENLRRASTSFIQPLTISRPTLVHALARLVEVVVREQRALQLSLSLSCAALLVAAPLVVALERPEDGPPDGVEAL